MSSQVFARILIVGAALLALHYLRRQRRQRQCCRIVVASSSVARRFSPAIKGLIECSFPEDLADEDTRAAMEEDALSVLCGFHDVDACEWLLAIQGAHVVGLAMLVKYHDTLFVSSLCVLPEHRGCGVGSRLMRSASSYAEAHGLGALSGSVKAAHQASERRTEQLVQFYRRLGGTVETACEFLYNSVAARFGSNKENRLNFACHGESCSQLKHEQDTPVVGKVVNGTEVRRVAIGTPVKIVG